MCDPSEEVQESSNPPERQPTPFIASIAVFVSRYVTCATAGFVLTSLQSKPGHICVQMRPKTAVTQPFRRHCDMTWYYDGIVSFSAIQDSDSGTYDMHKSHILNMMVNLPADELCDCLYVSTVQVKYV